MAIYKITMPDCNDNIKRATKAYRDTNGSQVEFERIKNRRGKRYIELTFTDIEFYVSIVRLGFTGSLNVKALSLPESQSHWYDENMADTAGPILRGLCEKPISNSVDEHLSPSKKQSSRLADCVEQHLQHLRQYSLGESKNQIAYKILEEFQTALSRIQRYLEEEQNQEIVRKRIVSRF